MSKRTPGPWNREAIYRLLRFSRKNSGPWDDNEIWPEDDSMNMPDEDDDADLIAAAPDLLEALIGADLQLEWAAKAIEAGRYDEALMHCFAMPRRRKSAIAKAKGGQVDE